MQDWPLRRVNAVRFTRDVSEIGAPEEIRTPDPQIRNLYSLRLLSCLLAPQGEPR
jgi:hypothetical protein